MAIKQADLGVGISNTDGSFAADFAVPDILGVDYVVREGKATLQNVIEVFRYYAGISVLKYVASMICITDKSSMNDNMFTYFNYASTLEIVLFLCLSKPSDSISTSYPNDNLMSLENHLLFLGLFLIESAGLIGVQLYITSTPNFLPTPDGYFTKWEFNSQTTTAMFLAAHLLFIYHVLCVYRGSPWKQNFWYNYVLSIWIMLVIGVNVSLFLLTKYLNPFFGMV